jgi:hypothetical protein
MEYVVACFLVLAVYACLGLLCWYVGRYVIGYSVFFMVIFLATVVGMFRRVFIKEPQDNVMEQLENYWYSDVKPAESKYEMVTVIQNGYIRREAVPCA